MSNKIVVTDENIIDVCRQEIAKQGLAANLNHLDTSNVTMFNKLFGFENMLNFRGNISEWDFTNARYFEKMFSFSDFNNMIIIHNNGLLDFQNMFEYSSFNQPVSHWNVDVQNIDIRCMFEESAFAHPDLIISKLINNNHLTNQDISSYKTHINDQLNDFWKTDRQRIQYIDKALMQLKEQELSSLHFQWALYQGKIEHPAWTIETTKWMNRTLNIMNDLQLQIPVEQVGQHLVSLWHTKHISALEDDIIATTIAELSPGHR